MFRGLRAHNTPRQAPLCPKRRPLRTQHPVFSVFAEVVCTVGTTPPQTVISPPPNGGNGVIRTTTRRRHADSSPLMLQNPHRHRHGGHRRDRRAWPRRRRDRKAGLRGTQDAVPVAGGAWPDNEPKRRSKLAARTARGPPTVQPGPTAGPGSHKTRGPTSNRQRHTATRSVL